MFDLPGVTGVPSSLRKAQGFDRASGHTTSASRTLDGIVPRRAPAERRGDGALAAAPDYSVPFAVHVFILKTRDHLRAAAGHEHASAFSITPDEPDHAGVGATMLFNLEDIELSLAAHEATHVALTHHSNIEATRIGAKRWLWDHPESVAEMTGNLTALVWAKLYEHGVRDE